MNARPDPNFHVSCRSSSKRARRAAALARRSGRSARRNAAHSAMPKGGSSDLDELLASRANDPQVAMTRELSTWMKPGYSQKASTSGQLSASAQAARLS